jgi:hypothetical protein
MSLLRRRRTQAKPKPDPLLYVVCDTDGEEVSGRWRGEVRRWPTMEKAVDEAVAMLYDDPEAGEFTVWQLDPSGNLVTHLRTITFGPDASWNSIVVVLEPGEHVRAPGPVPRRISEEDLEGYSLDDSKRWSLEQRLGEWP